MIESQRTMTVKEVAEFLGKHPDTVRRALRTAGVTSENGKTLLMGKEQVSRVASILFKNVPLAVKESINMTFASAQGTPSDFAKVDSTLTEKDIRLISSVVSMTVSETMKQFDERVTKIESRVEGRQALLPAPSMSPRDHINKLAREYANRHSIGFSEAYTTLYREFGYRTHSNPSISAKNRGMAIIDYIEAEGQIETLEAVAMEVFK